jgi:putative two-component system response regulator
VSTIGSAPALDKDQATLLIVDDTAENLGFLAELLLPTYRVRVANSGVQALRVAASAPQPDLILLDVMMPDMNGHAVLARLREEERTRGIPVIFVTAKNTAADEEQGLDGGAVDYIAKPLRPAVVLARVRTQLELKRARDRLAHQNAFLEGEVARRLGENQLIQDVSIHALARLAETRDPETGNHLRRTRKFVQALAGHLRQQPRFSAFLSSRNIHLLAMSATLHDIGKVGIPDHILLKPGKLTPEEREVMKTHARIGADAIAQAEIDAARPVEFLTLAKEIAHYHHERWDGGGYPEGLVGDVIPLSARLMALADVYDALTSQRVYKAPLALAEARDIVVAERGRHFDPAVVDAFLAVIGEFEAVAGRYGDDAPEGGR